MSRASIVRAVLVLALALARPATAQSDSTRSPVSVLTLTQHSRTRLQSTMRTEYPTLLRDAGVGGDVTCTFIVRADGSVDPTTITVMSSDNPDFDPPAEKVLRTVRFEPITGVYRVLATLRFVPSGSQSLLRITSVEPL
jgi:TonB family protein